MMRGSQSSLKTVLHRFIFGMIIAVIGSWSITALRLEQVREYLVLTGELKTLQLLDYILLGITAFGLVVALLTLPQLVSRISRVASLGEQKW
jgi:hypothetical protein